MKTLINQLNAKSLLDLSSVGRVEESSVHLDMLRWLVRIRQVGRKQPYASHLGLDY